MLGENWKQLKQLPHLHNEYYKMVLPYKTIHILVLYVLLD